MATSSFQVCDIPSCTYQSFATCHCCSLHICTMHLNEHSNHHESQLTLLTNKINILTDRISSSDLPFVIALEQWRVECKQTIDSYCNAKRQNFLNDQLEELDRLRSNVEESKRRPDVTEEILNKLKTSIERLEQDLNEVQFNFYPLNIDEKMIIRCSQDLLPLSSPHKTIALTDCSYAVLAGNGQHLLVHREPNLTLLDRKLTIIQETTWPLNDICDICWSSAINRFIVINSSHIFAIDETEMILQPLLSSCIVHWMRGTCSDSRLYLSTEGVGSSIFEYTLIPSTKFIKEWQSPVTCTKDEWIEDLKFHNGFLGLVIGHSIKNEARLEVRLSTTLQSLWSIRLDSVSSVYSIRCCPIIHNQWLVVAFRNPTIFHISSDGKLITVNKTCNSPSNISQIGNDLLAIWDQKYIYLHKLC